MACTHPSDYVLINFFNKDVAWDAGFLEGVFGEVGGVVLLDNLFRMCLMLCAGNAAQTRLERWAPEISLLLGRGLSMFCLPWWSKMWSQIRACIQSFQRLEELRWKQNRSLCHSPEWVWVCSLSQPVLWLAMREVNLFLLCWWSIMKCEFCRWFLVQVKEDLLFLN